jgi:transposase-like protein
MAKYNKKIVDKICELIESDSYTIAEICEKVGIHKDTYYEWIKNKADFTDSIEKARQRFDEILVKEAKNSLRKLVNGYTVDETKTVYEPTSKTDSTAKPKIKEQTITKKHFQPSVPAVIFALTNKASEEYKNRQHAELTGKDGKELIPARVLTKKEAKELLDDLNNEY